MQKSTTAQRVVSSESVMNEKKPTSSRKPLAAPDLVKMKRKGRAIAMLTAYDYYTARILDEIATLENIYLRLAPETH